MRKGNRPPDRDQDGAASADEMPAVHTCVQAQLLHDRINIAGDQRVRSHYQAVLCKAVPTQTSRLIITPR